jgi:hypothetical protein
VTDQGVLDAHARDVSTEGMSLVCDETLYLGEIYAIRISVANHPEVELTAKLIWSDLYGIDEQDRIVAMGICFAQISRGDRRFFQDVVASHIDKKP